MRGGYHGGIGRFDLHYGAAMKRVLFLAIVYEAPVQILLRSRGLIFSRILYWVYMVALKCCVIDCVPPCWKDLSSTWWVMALLSASWIEEWIDLPPFILMKDKDDISHVSSGDSSCCTDLELGYLMVVNPLYIQVSVRDLHLVRYRYIYSAMLRP